ncbi:hypothetical protein FRC03_009487 [Tulasnella sp. 419]|nr:hypothetical protein FRC03_009487 [Tulasnella sp. 419]
METDDGSQSSGSKDNDNRTSTKSWREISEYTHLLRSLRAAQTEDVTTHLTALRHQPQDLIQDIHDGIGSNNENMELVARPSIRSAGQGRRSGTGDVSRNLSARWPLKPVDVQRPLYSLEDEVRLIARQHLTKEGGANNEDSERLSQDEDEEESILTEELVSALSGRTLDLLHQTLNGLLGHRPSVPPSLTNRLKPLGWETLLSELSTSGAVDPSVIKNSYMRLSRLFPSTETLPIPVPVYRRLAEDEPNGGSQEIGLKSGQGPLARSSEHDGTLALDYTSDYELLEYVASQSTNSKPKSIMVDCRLSLEYVLT